MRCGQVAQQTSQASRACTDAAWYIKRQLVKDALTHTRRLIHTPAVTLHHLAQNSPVRPHLVTVASQYGVRIALLNATLSGDEVLRWHSYKAYRTLLSRMLSNFDLIVPVSETVRPQSWVACISYLDQLDLGDNQQPADTFQVSMRMVWQKGAVYNTLKPHHTKLLSMPRLACIAELWLLLSFWRRDAPDARLVWRPEACGSARCWHVAPAPPLPDIHEAAGPRYALHCSRSAVLPV